MARAVPEGDGAMRNQGRHRCCRLAILALLVGACAAPTTTPAREAPAAPRAADAGAAAPAAPAVAPPSPPPPARLAQVEPGMVVGLIPVRAGAERGLFAEEGIELEFTSVLAATRAPRRSPPAARRS